MVKCFHCGHIVRIQGGKHKPMDKRVLDGKLHSFFHDVIRQSFRQLGINDSTVTRYMADQEFQQSAFPILAREIFETVRGKQTERG